MCAHPNRSVLKIKIGHLILMDLKIIRMRELEALICLKRSTIYKKINTDPTFPRPIPLSDSESPGAPVGFLLSEVLAWIESRVAKRAEG